MLLPTIKTIFLGFNQHQPRTRHPFAWRCAEESARSRKGCGQGQITALCSKMSPWNNHGSRVAWETDKCRDRRGPGKSRHRSLKYRFSSHREASCHAISNPQIPTSPRITMRSSVLLLSVLSLASSVVAQDVDASDIPTQCKDVCAPVVSLTASCDKKTSDDDNAERNCVCKDSRAAKSIPVCAACLTKHGKDGSDNGLF